MIDIHLFGYWGWRHAERSFEAADGGESNEPFALGLGRILGTDFEGRERWLAGYPVTGNCIDRSARLAFWPGRQYTNLLSGLQARGAERERERVFLVGVVAGSPASGEILNGLFDKIRGSLVRIAGAVEFHRAIALIIAIF